MIKKLEKHAFLFEELVKRDFKTKYKGTWLGMIWSVLLPLLMFLLMKTIFLEFFGRSMKHYTVYLLAGHIIFNYFSEASRTGMRALRSNSKIIEKVNVPKYLFVLSKNVQVFISFLLNLVVFFIFVKLDGISFSFRFLALIYPIFFILIFSIGMGFILSALYTFFNDLRYIYDVVLRFLSYMSAIFYDYRRFDITVQNAFFLNPVYCFIYYFRSVVIEGVIPPLWLHALIFGYSTFVVSLGYMLYNKFNTKFLYYL